MSFIGSLPPFLQWVWLIVGLLYMLAVFFVTAKLLNGAPKALVWAAEGHRTESLGTAARRILGEKTELLTRIKNEHTRKAHELFPEGTRSRTGELRPLKPGLGYTAIASGAAVVPVYVRGTNELGLCLLRRRRLEVRIGPPIRVRADRVGDDRKSEYRVLTAMVASELEMLRDEAHD